MAKKFKMSVIIPVYKVEKYLAETIDSVIEQTIGFENIEIILVNDGSPDNSEEICLKYKEMYPENIVYIKQDNSGVSTARNNGLAKATGEYINFLDSDDKWEKNAFEEAIKLFAKYEDISTVIFPMQFFEASTGEHILNKLYKGQKIDIREETMHLKLQSCSIIFKASAIKGRKYSKNLIISEDARLVTEILLDNPIVGVAKSHYLYRKRKEENSAIQTSTTKKTWYLDTPKHCYNYLLELSEKKYGKALEYVQNLVIYDLKWRLTNNPKIVLNENELEEYYKLLRKALGKIEDTTIAQFPLMSSVEKLYLLNFKYNSSDMYSVDENDICIKESVICSKNSVPVIIDNIFIKENELEIYGKMPIIKNVVKDVYLEDSKGEKIHFEKYELDSKSKITRNICIENNFNYIGIKTNFSLDKHKGLKLMVTNGKEEFQIRYTFSYNSILNNTFYNIYLRTKNYYVLHQKSKLVIKRKNLLNAVFLESKCALTLLKRKKIASLAYRTCANLYRLIKRKQIWIVSDRIQVAGDNGQAFFEYMQTVDNKNIKVYFDIGKNAKIYPELKQKYGKKILEHKSFKHKMLYLNADKIISSQADNYVYNLFGRGKNYIGDMYRFDFIYLQHGIIYNDLSPWLNINTKNMPIFVTSSELEYNSIVKTYRYNMPKEWIKLTGLPRYDKLLNKDIKQKKQIVIMPTWRNKLTTNIDVATGLRKYNPQFKNSDYFNFYNSLINNERLLKVLKESECKIKFMPHPNMMAQIDDFIQNEYVEFNRGESDYSKEFKENSLLITDYSSVFFDFSYLKKPIILTQFDKENFYEGQLYDKGYLDFEKDGFGPVCYDVETTVDYIIKYIKNDFKIEDKYRKRIEKFYKYQDQKNCERVYQEITKL